MKRLLVTLVGVLALVASALLSGYPAAAVWPGGAGLRNL